MTDSKTPSVVKTIVKLPASLPGTSTGRNQDLFNARLEFSDGGIFAEGVGVQEGSKIVVFFLKDSLFPFPVGSVGVIDTKDNSKSRLYDFDEVAIDPLDSTNIILPDGNGRVGAIAEGDGTGYVRCCRGCPGEPSLYGWYTPVGLQDHYARAHGGHFGEGLAWSLRRANTWAIIRKCAASKGFSGVKLTTVARKIADRDNEMSFGISDEFAESAFEIQVLCDVFYSYLKGIQKLVGTSTVLTASILHFAPCPAISLQAADLAAPGQEQEAPGKRKAAPVDLAAEEPPLKIRKTEQKST